MNVIISLKTGEIREITNTLSIEVTENKMTCLGGTEFHSIYMDTINNIRIADGLELHALFDHLDRAEDGECSNDALLGYLESGVRDWNARNNTLLNPSNTVKAYFERAETR